MERTIIITEALTLLENKITYPSNDEYLWSIELDNLKLIGEYTTELGYDFDNYFFLFGSTNNVIYQVSSLFINHDIFWTELSKKINAEVGPTLFASTNWKSKIMFPKSLEGRELFEVVKHENQNSFFSKIIFFFKQTEEIKLTDQAKSLLK